MGFITGLLIVGAIAGAAYFAKMAVTAGVQSILDLLRVIALTIDTLFFRAAAWAYSIFYELSSSSLLQSLNLASASQRLYTLLGIFMLFRLAFSFVKFIVNPDGMEKSSGKLLSNLAISLALIVSTPWIFNRAFELQSYIIKSNVIGNLIMGMNTTSSDANSDDFNAGTYGQSIAFLAYNAFFHPDYVTFPELSSCGSLLYYYTEVDFDDKANDDCGIKPRKQNDQEADRIVDCVCKMNKLKIEKGTEATEIGTRFFIASQRFDIGLIAHEGVFLAKSNKSYIISYTPIISTITLGFLAILFLNFSFDVAVRNVKLCFLQVIAPIPIILNIEPGDTKSDKKPLNWWIKECLHAYVELFIRIASVYFGVFLINVIFGSLGKISSNQTTWFQVFMMLGILLFVKQVPDMIGKAFGIDVKGKFELNPLKRLGENRLTSMALGGAAGLVAGGIGGAAAAYSGARSAGANRGEAIRRAMTGGIGGAAHSAGTGAKKGVKTVGDITGNAKQNWARSGHIGAANVGTKFGDRASSSINMALGVPTRADQDKNVVDTTQQFTKRYDSIKGRAATEIMKKNGADVSFNSASSATLRNFATTKGATDDVFDHTAGKETFRMYDAATGRYRSGSGADHAYTIGDYKTELAAFDAAKNIDMSSMTTAQKRVYAARLSEWQRGMGLKKKFVEGESAIEWAAVNDRQTTIDVAQLDNFVKTNKDVFNNARVMGSGTFASFDITQQKAQRDAADLVASTYGGSAEAISHKKADAAAKAKQGK